MPLVLGPNDRLIEWWVATRKHVSKPRHKAFDFMTIGVIWSLWLQQNDHTFERASMDALAVASSFLNLISLWMTTGLVDRSHLINE
jgi:hypothetical protein